VQISSKIKIFNVLIASAIFGIALNATQIYPVTPGVLESTKKIQEQAAKIESKLQEPSKRLANLQATFKESGCEGPGISEENNCMEQFKQIKSTFISLLSAWEEELPTFEKSVGKAVGQMRKNVDKYARKNTLQDLMEDMGANKLEKKAKKRRKRKGLSSYLANVVKSFQVPGTKNSMVSMGFETYAEFKDVEDLLGDLQTQISHQQMMMQFPDDILYDKSGEMGQVLQTTMLIIYGDQEDIGDGGVVQEIEEKQNENVYWFK